MRRYNDLIRLLLIMIQKFNFHNKSIEVSVEGYSTDAIGYHLFLMGQAGFIGVYTSVIDNRTKVSYITQSGQDVLSIIRNDERWKDFLSFIASKNIDLDDLPFSMIVDIIKNDSFLEIPIN